MMEQKEPRIKIDPLPETKRLSDTTKTEKQLMREKKETKYSILPSTEPKSVYASPARYASGKRIGRPPKPNNEKKVVKKTDDTYTMTEKRKRALEKARVMKSLKREERLKQKQEINEEKNPVDFKPSVINSDIGNDVSGLKDGFQTNPKQKLNKGVIQDTTNKQIGLGKNGEPSIFDPYNNKIAELEQQIQALKKLGSVALTDIEYEEKKGIDQKTGMNNTFKQNSTNKLIYKPISIHHGRQQSSGNTHTSNPFATTKTRKV